jgi:hypothetical protein
MFAVKQNCGGIPDLISNVAQQELKDLPRYIKECAIVYIPEIGYLLSLPPWKEPISDEDWNVPGIEFLVCSFSICIFILGWWSTQTFCFFLFSFFFKYINPVPPHVHLGLRGLPLGCG